MQVDGLQSLISPHKGIYSRRPLFTRLKKKISNSGENSNTNKKINRRDFLKFAGAVGVGIIAAPFIGSIGRFMPSYNYYTSSNSQIQGQNNNDNDGLVRTAEATTTS